MNFFLTLVVLALLGGGYLMYTQDQEKIADLQKQLDDANAKDQPASEASTGTPHKSSPAATSIKASTLEPLPSLPAVTPAAPTDDAPTTAAPAHVAPAAPAVVAPALVAPDVSHSSAIDSAATAATAASGASTIGTIQTLDGHTYTNCKVLKVEKDGVTFSHDDGITKILYPLMPPNIQKMFDYDPQKAVQETDAQIHYDQQAAAASNAAPANP